MKKVVITFGLISGAIIAVLVWVIAWLCEVDLVTFDRAELIGYASMLIALSMIFFGIKSYRDNYAGGAITFWKGVQIGLLISLIGALLYWASAVAYNVAHPGFQERFVEKFTEHTVNTMRADGASQQEIDAQLVEIEKMEKMLQNPLVFFVVALIEILPVGIIVTLLSAALLRRREVLPAEA